jgi:hypothetical protein
MDSERMFIELIPYSLFTNHEALSPYSSIISVTAELEIRGDDYSTLKKFMQHTDSENFSVYHQTQNGWFKGLASEIQVVSGTFGDSWANVKIRISYIGGIEWTDEQFDRSNSCQFVVFKKHVSRETIDQVKVKPPEIDFIEYDFKGVNNGQ